MKTKFRGLVLTAILLSGSSMTMANDGSSIIGDLPGYGEDAYFEDDAAYADEDYGFDEQVAPVGHTERSVITRAPRRRIATPTHATAYAPVTASQMQAASFHGGDDCGCGSTSCGGGCGDGSCGTMSCGSSRKVCNVFDRCGGGAWGTFETLLWFTQPRNTPPLVLGSDPGTLPVLGQPGNVTTLFGGQGESDMTVGGRADVGFWLSDNVGVGGRFWMLDESGDSFSAASDGSDRSLGRSYFNTSNGAVGEDALLIALDGVFQGSVRAESKLDVLAAEAYARLRFGCSKNCNLDFIGGYSHFQIEDSLSINSTTINTIASGGNPIGTRRDFADNFNADNEFNGGQLGFLMNLSRGRWTASSLTKVHLGNMNQSVSINGTNTRQIPAGPLTINSGGVLAGVNAINEERDVFAFAPEANFKLGYKFRPNVAFTVGYSFIYFDNVAMAGDQINRLVDGSSIGTGVAGTNPTFEFADSSLWVQGIDLGVAIDF